LSGGLEKLNDAINIVDGSRQGRPSHALEVGLKRLEG
jgi:hypothetical protein